MNGTVAAALLDGYRRFEADADAKVLVLTGAGDEAFCAGADLKAIDTVRDRHEGPLGFTRLTPTKPTIAAVSGWCVAGRHRARALVRPAHRRRGLDVRLLRAPLRRAADRRRHATPAAHRRPRPRARDHDDRAPGAGRRGLPHRARERGRAARPAPRRARSRSPRRSPRFRGRRCSPTAPRRSPARACRSSTASRSRPVSAAPCSRKRSAARPASPPAKAAKAAPVAEKRGICCVAPPFACGVAPAPGVNSGGSVPSVGKRGLLPMLGWSECPVKPLFGSLEGGARAESVRRGVRAPACAVGRGGLGALRGPLATWEIEDRCATDPAVLVRLRAGLRSAPKAFACSAGASAARRAG